MRYNRIRFVCAPLLAALCVCLPDTGRSDDKTAPPPRPVTPEVEAKLAGRTPEEARAVLDQLAQEWIARKGAVEVAHQRFKTAADQYTQSLNLLAGMKQVDGSAVPLILNPADVDRAMKAAQQHAEFHAARVKHLESTIASTTALTKLASEFDNAAKGFHECRDKIVLALKLVAKQPAVQVPSALTQKQLDADTERVKGLTAEVKKTAEDAKNSLGDREAAIKDAKAAAVKATAKLEELKATSGTMRDALAFEERLKGMKPDPLLEEFKQIRKTLVEKTGAIKGNADDYVKAAAAAAEARAKLDAIKNPSVAPEEKLDPSLPPLEQAFRKLLATQQSYAAGLRAINEIEERAKALVTALDELETKAKAYSGTLEDSRKWAAQLAAVAAEIERRVGRGDLEAARVPDGVAEAAGTTGERAKLDAELAAVRDTLEKLRAKRNELQQPSPERENIKSLIAGLHSRVSERMDLLTDLKKLAADYAAARKDRPESEQKRMDQLATNRNAKDAGPWEPFFALDHSKPSTNIAALLDSYYKELIDLDERDDNLRRQKESLEKMIDLAEKKEADEVAKLRAVLGPRSTARIPGKESEWEEWLESRLAPTGISAEAGIYRNEIARLNTIGGANARRVATLTGNAPVEAGKGTRQTEQPATGGDIGKARGELMDARIRGLAVTGGMIAIVLLAAMILPWLITFILRRAIRGGSDDAGNPSPVLSALRGALKIAAWIGALALILSILGYDVTALIVALAIGVLAVALAARPMIADVLGSIVIFAERRFKVGDVVRLGSGEPARVVGLTWRSTTLKNTSGLAVSVPNRTVTETTVENMSRDKETYDALSVTISTDKDAGKVINVIRAAMAQCKNLSPDHGVTVVTYNQKGLVKVVQYRFWWFLKDYEARNKTRDEVFARIALGLAHEDMSGIEITLV